MSRLLQSLLLASVLWPVSSFAQSIFINSPAEGETVRGPTTTIRMSVSDFDLGKDGRISIEIDGFWIADSDRLRVTVPVFPGTHEITARLVDRRGKTIETSEPDSVKFTVNDI